MAGLLGLHTRNGGRGAPTSNLTVKCCFYASHWTAGSLDAFYGVRWLTLTAWSAYCTVYSSLFVTVLYGSNCAAVLVYYTSHTYTVTLDWHVRVCGLSVCSA